MIQFAKPVFSENSLHMLEFSILVEMLHNTDYVILSGFAAWLPATVFTRLAEGQVSSILHNAVK